MALTLQRSFLPAALPAIPGMQMAFRYLPASDQAEVGGDFYEALPLAATGCWSPSATCRGTRCTPRP